VCTENRQEQQYLFQCKVDFILTLLKRDKEGQLIIIKGEIHQKKISTHMHPISSNIL
jgi:hypothetical protein